MTNCQPAPTSLAIEAQGIVKQFIRPGQSGHGFIRGFTDRPHRESDGYHRP